MEPRGNGGKKQDKPEKDKPAKKFGGTAKRKDSPVERHSAAAGQETVRQDKIAQQSGSDRTRGVLSVSHDEAGSSDIDAQALPGTAIAENASERHQKISAAAYARAERRGFEPGKEEEDWLRAEAELYGDYMRDGGGNEQQRGKKREQQRPHRNESQ